MGRGQEEKCKRLLPSSMAPKVEVVEANGDCFYAAVCCLLKHCMELTVKQLRIAVAEAIGEETFSMFLECAKAQVQGYEFMFSVSTVEGLKARISETSKEAGLAKCIWADAFAVQTVSNHLGICIFIFNEEGRAGCSCIAIKPETSKSPTALTECIFLFRTRRVHYNLVTINGNSSTPYGLVPSVVLDSFGLSPAAPTVTENSACATSTSQAMHSAATEVADLKASGSTRKKQKKSHPQDCMLSAYNLVQRSESKQILVLWHDDCQDHVTSSQSEIHQEGPDRTIAILQYLRKNNNSGWISFSNKVPLADLKLIKTVHSSQYVAALEKSQSLAAKDHGRPLSPLIRSLLAGQEAPSLENAISMTKFSKGSYRAARRAAGAVCRGVEEALSSNSATKTFCAVRPPGHHAGTNGIDEEAGGCGFCLLNSIVIGALHAFQRSKDDGIVGNFKLAILDFDVHHGNGTQELLQRLTTQGALNPTGVCYYSIHLLEKFQDPDLDFFPGSGVENHGNVVKNYPICPQWSVEEDPRLLHCSEHRGREGFRSQIIDALKELEHFGPSLILVSAGFDAAEGDEGSMQDGKIGINVQAGRMPQSAYYHTLPLPVDKSRVLLKSCDPPENL